MMMKLLNICARIVFLWHFIEDQGGLSNIFFWNGNSSSVVIPDILTEGGVAFHQWYQDLTKQL